MFFLPKILRETYFVSKQASSKVSRKASKLFLFELLKIDIIKFDRIP